MVTGREFEAFQLCANGPGAVCSLPGESLTHQGLWGRAGAPSQTPALGPASTLLLCCSSGAPWAVSHGKPNTSMHRNPVWWAFLSREWATNYMGGYSGGARASGSLSRCGLVRPGSQLPKSSWGKRESKHPSESGKLHLVEKSLARAANDFLGQTNGYSFCRWQVSKEDDHPAQQNGIALSC